MRKTSEIIKKRLEDAGVRYWAGDNIANFIMPEEHEKLIDELTEKFEAVVNGLISPQINGLNISTLLNVIDCPVKL